MNHRPPYIDAKRIEELAFLRSKGFNLDELGRAQFVIGWLSQALASALNEPRLLPVIRSSFDHSPGDIA